MLDTIRAENEALGRSDSTGWISRAGTDVMVVGRTQPQKASSMNLSAKRAAASQPCQRLQ